MQIRFLLLRNLMARRILSDCDNMVNAPPKKGKYGTARLVNDNPIAWNYEATVPTKQAGDYHYYWGFFKKGDAYTIKMLRTKLLSDAHKKFSAEVRTLTGAIMYADRMSKMMADDAEENLCRMFGKKKDTDMHPFGL